MPAVRDYEIEITYTTKVTAETPSSALSKASEKIEQGFDDVRVSGITIREGF